MLSDITSLHNWWKTLSSAWKQIFIVNLELEGMFAPSDIEYIQTLETLDCSNSDIRSLLPIRHLCQLRHLDISNTWIQDISILSNLVQLEEFHACLCSLDRIEVLRQLPQLQVVDLSYAQKRISDLELIGEVNTLKQLYLNSCHLADPYVLLGFSQLEILSLYFNPICQEGKQLLQDRYSDIKVLL
ncbi:MAG: leucine-rich repeat domain-containing protein [Bacteroidota bacterium]